MAEQNLKVCQNRKFSQRTTFEKEKKRRDLAGVFVSCEIAVAKVCQTRNSALLEPTINFWCIYQRQNYLNNQQN
jgi:hypothetical protein